MIFSGGTQMGKQDDLGKRSGIGFAGKRGERLAHQILPARRARVTPQRQQSEETHGTPAWRVALAGNRATTSRAVIVTR